MTSIPVNAFSAPHVREVMQKQKLRRQSENDSATSSLNPTPVRKSAPDCIANARSADLSRHNNYLLDAFKSLIPSVGRKEFGRSISCTEQRMEIQIEIKDYSSDDISAASSPNSTSLASPSIGSSSIESSPPSSTLNVERKRFRFLSGQ